MMKLKICTVVSWILLSFCAISVPVDSACPELCSCKWKSGKKTAECIDTGLSLLPREIEHDTQVLVFNGNNLRNLPRLAFVAKSLLNLQKINLANCKLRKIDENAFSQLSNLVELDLSYNLLRGIPSMALRDTPALRHLNLAGNHIVTISSHSFANVPGLVYLDISNSKLHTISPLAFQPFTQLETLHIQENNIKVLPELVIKNLENSHGLRVHDNPWVCDCRTLPLWRLLVINRMPHPDSPICNSPRRMAGMQFDALQEEDFACPPKIRPVMNVIRGIAGENATVTCPVEGQPSPRVVWFIEDRPVINGSILGIGPQRVYIVNEGHPNKVSHLVITGAQEADSGQIRCIAINPAGRATANFTLAVTMKAIFNEPLNSGHIAGISIGLTVLAIIIFIVAFLLFARTRTSSSPTSRKERTPPTSYATSPSEPNPIQKPPRLTDLSTSSSTDPDLISEAEKSAKGNNNYSNGYLSNGRAAPSVSDAGDYTRMEGDSLYPSSLWDTHAGSVLHEHYNPGFVTHESPLHAPIHSSPFKTIPDPNFDPQVFGYPIDYGLPIPEVNEEALYGSRLETTLSSDDDKQSYVSRNELSQINQGMLLNPYQKQPVIKMYSMLNSNDASPAHMRIQENKLAGDVTLQEVGSMVNTSPSTSNSEGNNARYQDHLLERPWVPGAHDGTGAVPMGVPVLPPLPNNSLHRLKARDSPDEGYQEGTEV